jgi:enamine deaminase RidA (YjgF/YER057c/UK114 family)
MRAVTFLSLGLMILGAMIGCRDADRRKTGLPRAFVRFLNPEELPKSKVCSQAVLVAGPSRTIFISGQFGIGVDGQVVAGDVKSQTETAVKNVEYALASAGASLQHVAKCTIYLVQGQSAELCLESYQKAWADQSRPPALTVVYVAALAHPDALVAIDAVAVIPQD